MQTETLSEEPLHANASNSNSSQQKCSKALLKSHDMLTPKAVMQRDTEEPPHVC